MTGPSPEPRIPDEAVEAAARAYDETEVHGGYDIVALRAALAAAWQTMRNEIETGIAIDAANRVHREPMAQSLFATVEANKRLTERLANVEAIHTHGPMGDYDVCDVCTRADADPGSALGYWVEWPCPTVLAVRGQS